MLIRDAADDDMATVTAIYADAVLRHAASYETEPPTVAEMMRRRETVLARGFAWLVAERDGAVIGYAYANLFRERPAYRYLAEDSIYVAPDSQGAGVGLTLVESLCARTAASGSRQMLAVIGDAARSSGSIALHRKAGFVTCGRIEGAGFKFGRWLDTLFMQKSLGEGASSLPE